MNKAAKEKLRRSAKVIHESDLRFAQILASLEIAYRDGKKAAEG